MHVEPVRYQEQRCLHFITFSCYRRMPLLDPLAAKEIFEAELDRVRVWYGCYIAGYVVMPEHVHLLISEPERSKLPVVIQMLKQITSQELRAKHPPHFWQVRYYDFPVWSGAKRIEKLRYLHRNPAKRGLVEKPEDWNGVVSLCKGDRRDGRDRIAMDCPEARSECSCSWESQPLP